MPSGEPHLGDVLMGVLDDHTIVGISRAQSELGFGSGPYREYNPTGDFVLFPARNEHLAHFTGPLHEATDVGARFSRQGGPSTIPIPSRDSPSGVFGRVFGSSLDGLEGSSRNPFADLRVSGGSSGRAGMPDDDELLAAHGLRAGDSEAIARVGGSVLVEHTDWNAFGHGGPGGPDPFGPWHAGRAGSGSAGAGLGLGTAFHHTGVAAPDAKIFGAPPSFGFSHRAVIADPFPRDFIPDLGLPGGLSPSHAHPGIGAGSGAGAPGARRRDEGDESGLPIGWNGSFSGRRQPTYGVAGWYRPVIVETPEDGLAPSGSSAALPRWVALVGGLGLGSLQGFAPGGFLAEGLFHLPGLGHGPFQAPLEFHFYRGVSMAAAGAAVALVGAAAAWGGGAGALGAAATAMAGALEGGGAAAALWSGAAALVGLSSVAIGAVVGGVIALVLGLCVAMAAGLPSGPPGPRTPQRPDGSPATGGTTPSRVPDPAAQPRGERRPIPRNKGGQKLKEEIRGARRENESADILARHGYDVEQLRPGQEPNKRYPDYRIEGREFDNYAPTTGSFDVMAREIEEKLPEQATRIVLNLKDSVVSIEEFEYALRRWPIAGLDEIIAIKNSNVVQLFP
jgi:hypothetical protein